MNGELTRSAAPSKGLLTELYPPFFGQAAVDASPLGMRRSTRECFQQSL